ncbi:hypothetical protein [Streptomyces sp. WG5]|uniref:hypothetical protein n=1 Tax=Streptomyces sp. WG5 TaxID=3417648 RepID=UPI003CF60270
MTDTKSSEEPYAGAREGDVAAAVARGSAGPSGGVFGPAGEAEVCARVLGEHRHGLDPRHLR